MSSPLFRACWLLLFAAYFTNELGAQAYTPFFTNNVEWTMKKVYPTIGPGDNTDYWKIYTQNDTLIGGKQYRQVAIDKMCRLMYAMGQLTVVSQFQYDQFPIGALREEDKKVYFYKYALPPEWLTGGFESVLYGLSPDQDHLLYDFGALPGDTVFFSNNQFTIINEVLNPVQNLAVKKVTPSNTFIFPHETGTWTEGIGSSYGLLGSYDSYLHYLVCFKMNNVPLVYNGECQPCSSITAVEESLPVASPKVFPNPATDQLYVEEGQGTPPFLLRLLDPIGQFLMEKEINHSGPVELPAAARGFNWILVEIRDADGRQWVQKLLLTRA